MHTYQAYLVCKAVFRGRKKITTQKRAMIKTQVNTRNVTLHESTVTRVTYISSGKCIVPAMPADVSPNFFSKYVCKFKCPWSPKAGAMSRAPNPEPPAPNLEKPTAAYTYLYSHLPHPRTSLPPLHDSLHNIAYNKNPNAFSFIASPACFLSFRLLICFESISCARAARFSASSRSACAACAGVGGGLPVPALRAFPRAFPFPFLLEL